jgi:hypothetical protein
MIFKVDVKSIDDFTIWVQGNTRHAVEQWARNAYWHKDMKIEEDRRPSGPHRFHWLGGEGGTKHAKAKP